MKVIQWNCVQPSRKATNEKYIISAEKKLLIWCSTQQLCQVAPNQTHFPCCMTNKYILGLAKCWMLKYWHCILQLWLTISEMSTTFLLFWISLLWWQSSFTEVGFRADCEELCGAQDSKKHLGRHVQQMTAVTCCTEESINNFCIP